MTKQRGGWRAPFRHCLVQFMHSMLKKITVYHWIYGIVSHVHSNLFRIELLCFLSEFRAFHPLSFSPLKDASWIWCCRSPSISTLSPGLCCVIMPHMRKMGLRGISWWFQCQLGHVRASVLGPYGWRMRTRHKLDIVSRGSWFWGPLQTRPDIFRFVTVNISRCGGPKLIEGKLQSYIAQYIVKPWTNCNPSDNEARSQPPCMAASSTLCKWESGLT
jgi:hypothetical protein